MQTLIKFKQSVEDHQALKDDLLKEVRELVKQHGTIKISNKMGRDKTYVNNTLGRKNISDENLIAIAETLEGMSNDYIR